MNYYVYPYSFNEAKKNRELDQWKESHQANIACREAVEKAINDGFDGMRLRSEAAKSVIEAFGYDRVNWVLSNTLQHQKEDGRYSHENKEWAKKFYFNRSREYDHTIDFVVHKHPAVVDGFVNQAKKAYEALHLFDHTHCIPDDHEQDYKDKVLVIDPCTLKDEYKSPDYQLFLADGGNGCAPHGIGRMVSGRFLMDGERNSYWRQDIIGVLDEKYLPDWANEKLADLSALDASQEDGMSMS